MTGSHFRCQGNSWGSVSVFRFKDNRTQLINRSQLLGDNETMLFITDGNRFLSFKAIQAIDRLL